MGNKAIPSSGIYCACKGCTERYVGCHSNCEKYKDFLQRNEDVRNQRKLDSIGGETQWLYIKSKRRK